MSKVTPNSASRLFVFLSGASTLDANDPLPVAGIAIWQNFREDPNEWLLLCRSDTESEKQHMLSKTVLRGLSVGAPFGMRAIARRISTPHVTEG